SLNEVVVVGYSKNKQKKENSIRINIQGATPANGLKKYNDYMEKGINKWKQKDSNNNQGNVQLLFTIDENSKPENIRVENSDCTKCTVEAIRLVQEGPKWNKRDKNKVVKMTIHF
ncbi:MAG TPA: energy transducer TonB, partial [Chitinophagaceae bacterium]|nr:energy transducer TonB [Chitinophagaceae bacterium]